MTTILNTIQWAAMVRAVIYVVCGALMARGYMSQGQVDAISNPETINSVIGTIGILINLVFTLRARSNERVVADASNVPGVKRIVASQKLADETPSTKVVSE